MSTSAEILAFCLTALAVMAEPGCASSSKPDSKTKPEPVMDSNYPLAVDAGPAAPVDSGPPSPPPVVDAGPPPSPKVKVQYIGMHVGGGPFDDATKKPFEKTIAPYHPKFAECWGAHVTKTKPFDMGVDLLIEGTGGRPKVSNPRVRFEKGEDDGQFVACIVAAFEAVDFPKLDRGKSGVSYSLRFTPTP